MKLTRRSKLYHTLTLTLISISCFISGATMIPAISGAQVNPDVQDNQDIRVAQMLEEYQRALQERDSVIADLTRRVQALEQSRDSRAGTPATAKPVAVGQPTRGGHRAGATVEGRRRPVDAGRPTVAQSEQPATPPGSAGQPAVAQGEQPPAPADTGLSEEEISRALERTLVQLGGLLLPEYTVEVTPELSYTYRTVNSPTVVSLSENRQAVTSARVRSDILQADLNLRVGLPWNTQATINLPYVFTWEDEAISGIEPGSVGRQTSHHNSGIGDVQLSFTKQILSEAGALPSLLASLTWVAPTGSEDYFRRSNRLSTGSGFHALEGSLTVVKSQDPLSFFGTFGYETSFSERKSGVDVQPGDSIRARIGTVLAASPQTSLQFDIDTHFIGKTALNGSDAAGTDQVVSMLEIGVSSVLSPQALLSVTAGIGVTRDSPDLQFMASIPYRF